MALNKTNLNTFSNLRPPTPSVEPSKALKESLLPCPFCGGKIIILQEVSKTYWDIGCGTSLCYAQYADGDHGFYDSSQQAADHWNKRAITTADDDEIDYMSRYEARRDVVSVDSMNAIGYFWGDFLSKYDLRDMWVEYTQDNLDAEIHKILKDYLQNKDIDNRMPNKADATRKKRATNARKV